jgi:hypothetical protein
MWQYTLRNLHGVPSIINYDLKTYCPITTVESYITLKFCPTNDKHIHVFICCGCGKTLIFAVKLLNLNLLELKIKKMINIFKG